MPVLLRPDGVVQIGWDPRRAVLVRPPDGATAAGLADVLRSMHAPVDVAGLRKSAGRHGISDRDADEILGALLAASVAKPVHGNRSARTLSVRVHGYGPLSELLVEALRPSAARVCQTSHSNALGSTLGFDLVVLADYLVTDPRFIRELHQASIPHLTVRVRDGTGMVGPLVVPGVTSCLTCADLHRSDRDAAWPAVAAQLRDMVGSAARPVLLATAALALGQLHRIIAGVRGSAERPAAPPATLDATLEIDLENNAIRTRRWTRHPRCECTDWSALPPPRQG